MKNLIKTFTVLILTVPLVFIGCQKIELLEDTQTKQTPNASLKSGIVYCGTPITVELRNWELTVNPGSVIVGNDETTLYVTFEATDDWVLTSTILYVGSVDNLPGLYTVINPDGTGSFAPWLFPYKVWHFNGTQSYTFNIDLNDLDDCFIVVAYSNVKNTDTGEEYIVWGKSLLKSSGYYFEYCKQDCEPSPPLGGCETAYAYGDQYANCFREYNKKTGEYNPGGPPKKNFSQWGWTNGELLEGNSYDFEIWAGAGQCNLSNGTLVGNLVVEYYGSTATVIYNIIPGYVVTETHLYIGDQPIPRKNNNKPTVAPGQYPYSDDDASIVEDNMVVYEINNLSGDIYVIAHSVVCDEFYCGPCDGGMTSLSLEYQGNVSNATIKVYKDKVEPNKLIKTFNSVNMGDILTFVGTGPDNKLGAKIRITINDDNGNYTEIHTSCSQPIGVGMVYDDTYLIVAGTSKNGGPLCETGSGTPECGPCDGQMTSLTLEYLGFETNATIKVYKDKVKPDKLIATFTDVNTGYVFSFVGTGPDNKLGAKIRLTINDDNGNYTEIHTSCSQPIGVGMVYDNLYLLLAGTSKNGGPLCD